ncbi:MAG: hypothetical protein COA97_07620 [Flavobacteriales bacterium]|nr:MAG: hypothetical protein COA97_07620 [Flavobacteriales bacterium]
MNATATISATAIEKEDVPQLTFPKSDVLLSEMEQSERKRRIVRAMKLGNNGKYKVKIIFEDLESLKKVETTIWGVTEKNIILKKGTLIPIHRIHEIKFF